MDVLEKVAKTLSRNYGINLSFRGTKAYTDGKRIVIPALPENLSESMVTKIRGYCDHEIGHVRFTNMRAFKGISNKAVQNMTNLIEDFRIEKLMGGEYLGCKKNMESLANLLMTETEGDRDDEHIMNKLWLEGRRHVCGYELEGPDGVADLEKVFGAGILDRIANLRSTEEAITLATEMCGKYKTPPKPERKDEEGKAKGDGEGESGKGDEADDPDGEKGSGDSESESGGEGEDELSDEGEDSDGESGGDEGDDESDSDRDGGESDDDSDTGSDADDADGEREDGGEGDDGDQEDASEGEDRDDGEGEESGEGSDAGGSEAGDSEDETDGGEDEDGADGSDAGSDSEGEDGGDDDELPSGDGGSEADDTLGDDEADASPDDEDGDLSEGKEAAGTPNPNEGDDKIDPEYAADREEELSDWEDRLKGLMEEFEKTAPESAGDEYTVICKDYDILEPFYGDHVKGYNELRESLGSLVSIKNKVSSLFLAKTASRWFGGKEEGKLDARTLATVPAGNKRVFKQKVISRERDTAVTFLVDWSGSMGYRRGGYRARSRIENAMRSVVLFIESLARTKVKSEVLAYTTKDLPESFWREAGAKSRREVRWGRVERLVTYILKAFDEPLNSKVKGRIGAWEAAPLSENCDGENVKIAWQRLKSRKERRKVLFVLSDGAVANCGDCEVGRKYLKEVCDMIKKDGEVELIGIGLDTNVGHYYEKSIRVSGEDLASQLFNEVRKILKV